MSHQRLILALKSRFRCSAINHEFSRPKRDLFGSEVREAVSICAVRAGSAVETAASIRYTRKHRESYAFLTLGARLRFG